MSPDNVSTSYMDQFTINGHEVVDGDVKATGNGAHVYVPKRWRGADVKVVRTSEPTDE
jgi:putative transposon-encoded protein